MKKNCETCLEHDRKHQAADCLYCAQFNRQLPVEENHFYRMATKGPGGKSRDCVVKCTQIQDFIKTAGYNVYHFKYSGGEIVVTDQDKCYAESFYHQGHEIKYEIINKEMCNTSIEFIDDDHYKKLVNKNTYKIYEMK